MYDIFYVSPGEGSNKDWTEIKSRYPLAQRLTNINTYEEIRSKSFTKMFWVIWDDIDLDFSFDLSEYRATKWDDMYVHIFKNGKHHDGICLFPRSQEISNREFRHRFFTAKKQVDINASFPKSFDKFYINTYDEYLTVISQPTTDMFWVVWDDIIVNDTFDFTYYVPTYDVFHRNITHVFKNDEYYDGICLFSKNAVITKKEFHHRFFTAKKEVDIIASYPKQYKRYSPRSYDEYLNIKDDMFWIVWPEISVTNESIFDLYFSKHNSYDRKENHMFKHYFNGEETYANGIILCSREKKISQREFKYRFLTEKKEHDILASKLSPYDIVFISYNEPNADENFNNLIAKYPRAKRVHGVKGIHQAHIKAAELCQTDMIWIIDGDAIIVDDFDFEYLVPDAIDKRTVRVWRSKNPVNDLEYGYGGIKLLPREMTLNMDNTSTDMTTSIGEFFKAEESVSNLTAFNTDPFNTWKSAFRECCKLSSRIIDRQDDNETTQRLDVWCTVGEDKPYGKYSILGAKMGKEFGLKNKNDPDKLKKINDFDWLEEMFKNVN